MDRSLLQKGESFSDPVDLVAVDVTGIRRIQMPALDGHRLVGEVAQSVAQTLELPDELPWTLRDQGKARMLQDDRPLGVQVESGTEVVLIPKAHLA